MAVMVVDVSADELAGNERGPALADGAATDYGSGVGDSEKYFVEKFVGRDNGHELGRFCGCGWLVRRDRRRVSIVTDSFAPSRSKAELGS